MSSAILYVAIVAIWACVLIPRWLRRDSSPSASESYSDSVSSSASDPVSSSASDPAEEQAGDDMTAATAADEEPARRRRRRGRRDKREDAPGERRPAPDDLAHRRVLSARRRLLGMLIVLAITSGVLAGTRLAAWWVVVPPSVMLLGYLPLLRAAAKADAERREMVLTRAAHAAVPERSRVRAEPPHAVTGADVVALSVPADPAEKEIDDQYTDVRRRAVGD